jgi:UDP-N-acetylglucosamine 2-epimerase (non-hydrolysing)
MKIWTVIGTRPEAIKLAPVVMRLADEPGIEQRVVLSGQHRELLYSALDVFGIKPHIDLALMRARQHPGELLGRAVLAFDPLLDADRPDWIVVQGDTTTAAAASLAAFYRKIRVAHVEAGLRTGDLAAPFPEEANRQIIDRLATLHFAPTTAARGHLLAEGHDPSTVVVTGNTAIDALLHVVARAPRPPDAIESATDGRRLVLVTTHRRESIGPPLQRILAAVRELARRHTDIVVVYPVHLNPDIRPVVVDTLRGAERVVVVKALDYEAFVALMARCALILTDSGGIQEEAPSLGKPVLVLRNVTERPEAIESGAAELVGTDPQRILASASRLLNDSVAYAEMGRVRHVFGDGRASERIVAALRAAHASA